MYARAMEKEYSIIKKKAMDATSHFIAHMRLFFAYRLDNC